MLNTIASIAIFLFMIYGLLLALRYVARYVDYKETFKELINRKKDK